MSRPRKYFGRGFSEVPGWMGLEKSQDDPTIVGLTAQVTIFQVQGEN